MNECTILVQDLFNAVVRNDSYGTRRFKSKLLEHHGDKIHIVNDGKNPSLVILRKNVDKVIYQYHSEQRKEAFY